MKAYIEVARMDGILTNRFNGQTKNIVGQLQGKPNRRLAKVQQSNGVLVDQWIDNPGFKVEVVFEDGTRGTIDARYLNIIEAKNATVEVVK